jgi:hypothetical protein
VSLQSSLARVTPSGPKTEAEVKAECKRAFHRDGVICLKPEWFTGWGDRQQLIMLAEKQFGKRTK